jgi:hypothetical protein
MVVIKWIGYILAAISILCIVIGLGLASIAVTAVIGVLASGVLAVLFIANLIRSALDDK